MTENYIAEIETKFSKIRGRGLMLSPKDFTLVKKWEEKQIPLRIVKRAMDDVHKKFKEQNRKDNINSLSYFKQAVEKEFAEWKQSQVGKNQQKQPVQIEQPQTEISDDFICKSCKFYNNESDSIFDFIDGWCESEKLNDSVPLESNPDPQNYMQIFDAREVCNPDGEVESINNFKFFKEKK